MTGVQFGCKHSVALERDALAGQPLRLDELQLVFQKTLKRGKTR